MRQITWRYDEEYAQWEGDTQDFRTTIQANEEHNVYVAWIDPPDDASPMKIAPRSFPTLQEAQEWCASMVDQWVNLQGQIAETLENPVS
jgi:uncharacterized protein YbaA (DUF1428 family)